MLRAVRACPRCSPPHTQTPAALEELQPQTGQAAAAASLPSVQMSQSFSKTPRRGGREQHVQASWSWWFLFFFSSPSFQMVELPPGEDASVWMLQIPHRIHWASQPGSGTDVAGDLIREIVCRLNHVAFLDCWRITGVVRGGLWHLSQALLFWQSSLSPDGPIKWWRKANSIFAALLKAEWSSSATSNTQLSPRKVSRSRSPCLIQRLASSPQLH